MANFNRVMLMGNLTRDPELRYTPQGTAVVNLGLAVNRRYRDKAGEQKEEVCYVTVVVWDKQAENCNQYLRKGQPIFVEGRLQSRSWEDKNGQKRNVTEVRADVVQFLGSPQKSQAAAQSAAQAAAQSAVQEPKEQEESYSNNAWLEEGEVKTDDNQA